ncbi:MAG: peptide chain release factor aRF-1, partial [Candidatus Aenigmarchaeota archaeon]|nr:peptide chain release factor aRF-1 [Candidatus Aenigmarchaeota archaeon]
ELANLRDMIKEKEGYGLLIMDTKEATVGILQGKTIHVLRHLDSIVPSKVGKGGQSQQRFERVRDGLINDFYKKVAETVKDYFSNELKGIIIGGPGPSKYNFFDGGYLQTDIKNKVLGIKDVGYTDEPGLNELVEKASDLLAEAAVSKEKMLVQKFFENLQKDTGMVTYGLKPVLKALELGAVKTILITEDLEYSEVEYQCSCGESGVLFLRNEEIDQAKCKKCNQKINPIGVRDIVEAFEEMSKTYGTEVEIISRSTGEGEQLFQLGGIGAILRYKL